MKHVKRRQRVYAVGGMYELDMFAWLLFVEEIECFCIIYVSINNMYQYRMCFECCRAVANDSSCTTHYGRQLKEDGEFE